MPTYMPFQLGVKEVRELGVEIRPTGRRKFLRIPYLFHFPYFSGTLLELELVITNYSQQRKKIHYNGLLHRLSGITRQPADFIAPPSAGDLEINPKCKGRARLHFVNLPQPGNYVVQLELGGDIKVTHGKKDIVYFDALPKDATTFNVAIVIISGLIGVIIGLVLGKVV